MYENGREGSTDDGLSAAEKKPIVLDVRIGDRGAVVIKNEAKVHLGTAYWGHPLC